MADIRTMSAEEDLERIRFEATCNEASALGYARREGMREAATKIAKRCKDCGMDINIIAEVTDLTVDDILRL